MPTITPDLIHMYVDSDALRLAELVRDKAVTPAELTEVAISLIEQLDPKLNAVVIRAFDKARARAAQLSQPRCIALLLRGGRCVVSIIRHRFAIPPRYRGGRPIRTKTHHKGRPAATL